MPGYVTATSYELDGQTKSITYANSVVTSFTYDLNRRWLKSLGTQKGANAALINNAYARDAVGPYHRHQRVDAQ